MIVVLFPSVSRFGLSCSVFCFWGRLASSVFSSCFGRLPSLVFVLVVFCFCFVVSVDVVFRLQFLFWSFSVLVSSCLVLWLSSFSSSVLVSVLVSSCSVFWLSSLSFLSSSSVIRFCFVDDDDGVFFRSVS